MATVLPLLPLISLHMKTMKGLTLHITFWVPTYIKARASSDARNKVVINKPINKARPSVEARRRVSDIIKLNTSSSSARHGIAFS